MKLHIAFGLLAGFACLQQVTALNSKRSIRSISSHDHLDDVTSETDVAPAMTEVEQGKNVVVKKVKKAMKKILQQLGILDGKCEEKKKKNGIPSAADGDAPMEKFGYPHFDPHSGVSVLKAQAPLSFIGGFRQPVKVGALDWLVQGTMDDILKLLVCFGDYSALAETLGEDGRWHSDGSAGPLYIQMQNTAKYQGDVASILAAYSLDRIKGQIDAWGVIDNTIGQWWEPGVAVAKKAVSVYETFQQIQERVPDLTKEKFVDGWNRIANANGTDKLKEIAKLLRLNPESRELYDTWQNLDRVDRKSKLTVRLTAYPSRSPTMATFAFTGNSASLEEVAAALASATKDTTLDNLLKNFA
ncbi:conserved hypothetical protein [Neospora caninum Liverpool]|uniref:Uncharacterized protein n=1 Tax=Neospora caninum (strain Liverpool) TaxID=572307 RepID=F0VKC2_NEOCL|nr:conserved hypothetical protein [Neospora caninum Liverpool]CBZ54523.1 conserved hypothetical protein [Neospora caninum Liverpool]CEL69236.1 TPA: hypothetical protein BN1204_049520 [Neospora caninum Liverpool]|eukprot:XP_003884553.1 conserved hypothetical protein [Neospora caninum Liverpool]